MRLRRTYLLLVMLAAGAAAGCDNTVDPFEETDRRFSIFGYFDTATDTQFVRVVPFRRNIGGTEPRELNVDVSVTETETNVIYQMEDSLISFDDGSIGHVFFAPFRPQPGLTYRFEVAKDAMVSAWAETTIPPAENVHVSDPNQFAAEGIVQVVTWDEVEVEPFRVEVWYRFAQYPPYLPFREIVVPYENVGRKVDDGWRVVVNLTEDAQSVRPRIDVNAEPLLGVGMRLTMSDDAWRPPGGVFDSDVLVQPGVFSNVNGGFGFLGSVNQYTVEWVLSDLITRRLEFLPPG